MPFSTQGFGISIAQIDIEGVNSVDVSTAMSTCGQKPLPVAMRDDAPCESITVQWSVIPSSANPDDFKFEVHRSGTPDFSNPGDYDVVLSGKRGVTAFTDHDVKLYNWFSDYYYRIKATWIADPANEFLSDVIRVGQRRSEMMSPILREIRRRDAFRLAKLVGVPCAVFLKKRHGVRCNECWDWTLSRPRKSVCETCFRTGYIGGYYHPLLRHVQFAPPPKQPNIDRHGEEHRTIVGATALYDPVLNPGDIIQDLKTNEFWDVASLNPSTEKLRGIGHQNLLLYRLDRDDVECRVLGSVDITDLCPVGFRRVLRH